MKILVVCLGNICRSPLAEGLLAKEVGKRGLDWEIDSAGTGAWHVGEQPDRRSIEVARQNGLDISQQRARQIQPNDLEEYDLIFAMDRNNQQDILALAKTEQARNKVHPILSFSEMDHPDPNVPDPYWDDNGFKKVYQMLETAIQKSVDKILTMD